MIILIGNGMLATSIKEVFEKDLAKIKYPTYDKLWQFTRKDFDLSKVTLEELHHCITSKLAGGDPTGYCYPAGTILINCAAYTNVDSAELDRELSYDVNASGAYKLATFCKRHNIVMVQPSTDFIFDGRSPFMYSEYDKPNPVNYYGYTKLIAENMIQNSGCEHIIVRTGWLYNDERGIIPHFVKRLKNGEERLNGVTDQTISPTYTGDLAEQILCIVKNNLRGIFHATNSGDVHPDVLLKYLAEKLNIERKINETTRFTFYTGRAKRPYVSLLSNSNLEALGLHIMPHWKDSVDGFLKRNFK